LGVPAVLFTGTFGKGKKKMGKHAILGASKSEIWLNCPGAPALWEKVKELIAAGKLQVKESEYAAEGTEAHELLQKWATHYRDKSGAFIFPKNTPEDMKPAVKVAIDDLKKRWAPGSHKELVIEQEVSLEPLGLPDMFGTMDIGIVEAFGTLEAADYKHGRGVKVEIFKETALGYKLINTQLIYYALGLAALYDFNFKDVLLKIIQPRCAQGLPISEVKITIKELISYIDLFKKGVARTKQKGAKRCAGSWCRFCEAKPICEEGKGKYRNDARNDFDSL
jgi:hypothetical protein